MPTNHVPIEHHLVNTPLPGVPNPVSHGPCIAVRHIRVGYSTRTWQETVRGLRRSTAWLRLAGDGVVCGFRYGWQISQPVARARVRGRGNVHPVTRQRGRLCARQPCACGLRRGVVAADVDRVARGTSRRDDAGEQHSLRACRGAVRKGLQGRGQLLRAIGDGRQAVPVWVPPRQHRRDIHQRPAIAATQMRRDTFRVLAQQFLRARCEQERYTPTVRKVGAERPWRRLLQHHVRVRAAEPERVHTRPARPDRLGRPRFHRRGHGERRGSEVEVTVQFGDVQCRGEQAVLHLQERLLQARQPSDRRSVPHIAFDRADLHRPLRHARERLRQRLQLDRVTQPSSGAVRLDVADTRRINPRALVHLF